MKKKFSFSLPKGRTVGCALLAVAALCGAVLFFSSRTGQPTAAPAQEVHYVADVSLAGKRVLPVYGVERADKVIALTIDAAWGGDKTPEILSILKEKQVPATFFLVGRWVREFPDLTKAIADAGHTIGSHSDSHPHFCSLSDDQIRQEVADTEKALSELGIPKPTLLRPPFGEYDDRVVTVLRDAGYQVIQWTVDTLDWKEERTVDQVMEVVARKVTPGAIILCHNNANTIDQYLPGLIDYLKGEGYSFISLPELLYEGFNIDPNGIQHPPEAEQ